MRRNDKKRIEDYVRQMYGRAYVRALNHIFPGVWHLPSEYCVEAAGPLTAMCGLPIPAGAKKETRRSRSWLHPACEACVAADKKRHLSLFTKRGTPTSGPGASGPPWAS